MIGQRVSIAVARGRREGHAFTGIDGGGAGGEGRGRCNISWKRSLEVGHVERRRRGVVFRQHGEMHVRLEIRIGAPHCDARICLATGAARRGVEQVTGIAAHPAVKHQGGILQQASSCRVVFDVVLPDTVLRHGQRITLPLLQRRLVVGVDPIDPVDRRRVIVVCGKPAERPLADRVVVGAEATAATHDVIGISILLVRACAVGRAVGGVPIVRMVEPERMSALVVQHVHASPSRPHAVTAAPGSTAAETAVHPDDDAVVLGGIVSQLAGLGTGLVVDHRQTIDLGVLGDVPGKGLGQRDQRRDRRGDRKLSIGGLAVVAGHILHVAQGLILGVGRSHLIRIGHPDVEAAEVADRLRRSSREIVQIEARSAGTARLNEGPVFLIDHGHVRTVAKRDQPFAHLDGRGLLGHGFVRGHCLGGVSRNRADVLHHRSCRDPFADFKLPDRAFRHREFAIDRHASQRDLLPRHHRLHLAEDPSLVAHAIGRLEIPERESFIGNRHPGGRSTHVNLVVPGRGNRLLQRGHDLLRQLLADHPGNRLCQGRTRIARDERLELSPTFLGKLFALLHHRGALFRSRLLPTLHPTLEGIDLRKIRCRDLLGGPGPEVLRGFDFGRLGRLGHFPDRWEWGNRLSFTRRSAWLGLRRGGIDGPSMGQDGHQAEQDQDSEKAKKAGLHGFQTKRVRIKREKTEAKRVIALGLRANRHSNVRSGNSPSRSRGGSGNTVIAHSIGLDQRGRWGRLRRGTGNGDAYGF